MTPPSVERQVFDSLMSSQYQPAANLEAQQRAQISRLLGFAIQTLPFYAQRLAPILRRNGAIDLTRWNDVPILRRDEVLADLPPCDPLRSRPSTAAPTNSRPPDRRVSRSRCSSRNWPTRSTRQAAGALTPGMTSTGMRTSLRGWEMPARTADRVCILMVAGAPRGDPTQKVGCCPSRDRHAPRR